MGFIGGKRFFKTFPTKDAAERFQRMCLEVEAKNKPDDLRDLNDVVRHEVLSALAEPREHNSTITQAVDFYLKHARPAKLDATIGEIMEQFKSVKLNSECTAKNTSKLLGRVSSGPSENTSKTVKSVMSRTMLVSTTFTGRRLKNLSSHI